MTICQSKLEIGKLNPIVRHHMKHTEIFVAIQIREISLIN